MKIGFLFNIRQPFPLSSRSSELAQPSPRTERAFTKVIHKHGSNREGYFPKKGSVIRYLESVREVKFRPDNTPLQSLFEVCC
jgi:hypothetical protein